MAARDGSGKKSDGLPGSVEGPDKDRLICELKDRIATLEKVLRSTRESSTFPDTDECRQAMDALRESDERLNFSLMAADIGAWELNLMDHTAWRSLRHDQIFGYSRQLPVWTYEMFLSHVLPEDRDMVNSRFEKAIAAHTDWDFECRIRRADGVVRWMWAHGRAIYDESGQPVRMLGINVDINERKMVEEELHRSYEQLEHRVRERTIELQQSNDSLIRQIEERKRVEEALNAAKEQAELYVDLMGHDINNMNHSAMGYLELALRTLEMDKRLNLNDKVFIERPLQIIANSSALIDNVRTLQKLMAEGILTVPTDLQAILEPVKAQDFQTGEREVHINVQYAPGMVVEANELLKDVFTNLISNAVRHSVPDKPLTVSVTAEPAFEGGKKYFRCEVEDNGPGVPDIMKEKLFHRFQRGATRVHGKGLGLYLVRTLVEGYHGKVWVEDRVPGDYTKGAKFVVMLPAANSKGHLVPTKKNDV